MTSLFDIFRGKSKFPAKTLLVATAGFLATGLSAVLSVTSASELGRSGFSGNPDTNSGAVCTVCHSAGAAKPVVSLSGPATVNAGESHDYIVTISGGPARTAGINIASDDTSDNLTALDNSLRSVAAELSHSTPKAFVNNGVEFRFRWTAPLYTTVVNLYIAANSSNNRRDLGGDGIGHTQLAVAVVNGLIDTPAEPEPPAPGGVRLAEISDGLTQPVVITHAGDERLFIVERAGLIRSIDGEGNLRSDPFLDIRDRVEASRGELGFLGLAFHPDFANNGFFYTYYTYIPAQQSAPRMRLARFQVDPVNTNFADPGSEQIVMEFDSPFNNHNGGDLHFGPDAYLYIASGDGGGSGDPFDHAQNRHLLLGKLLRIDVDVNNVANRLRLPDCDISGNRNYRIPADNAYTDGSGDTDAGCDEIYASGLRNPWRFSFDRAGGDLWIADVGQNRFEEINRVPAGTAAGLNFGWRCLEADTPFNTDNCQDSDSYFPPVYVYDHDDGACSVTGGYVYRGLRYPQLSGRYFFADFCRGSVSALTAHNNGYRASEVLSANTVSGPVAFGQGHDGELYVAGLNTGRLWQLQSTLPLTDSPLRNLSYNGPVDNTRLGFITSRASTVVISAESAVSSPLADPALILTGLDGRPIASNENCDNIVINDLLGRAVVHATDACIPVILPPGAYVASINNHTNPGSAILTSITTALENTASLYNLSYNSTVPENGIRLGFIVEQNTTVIITAESLAGREPGREPALPDPMLALTTLAGVATLFSNDNCNPVSARQHLGRHLATPRDACAAVTLTAGHYVVTAKDVLNRRGNALISITRSLLQF